MTVALALVAALGLAAPGAPCHVAEVLSMWHPGLGGGPADLGVWNVTSYRGVRREISMPCSQATTPQSWGGGSGGARQTYYPLSSDSVKG